MSFLSLVLILLLFVNQNESYQSNFFFGSSNKYCMKQILEKSSLMRKKSSLIPSNGLNENLTPNDLPSLLLQHRVISIHSPLVPSVIETVIEQLLHFQLESPNEEITIQINSSGATAPDHSLYSFDLQAFAIVDMMLTASCPIRTICVGQANGFAALLLSLGKNGSRFALPNSKISFHAQRSKIYGRSYDIVNQVKYLGVTRSKVLHLLSHTCKQERKVLERDWMHGRLFSPDEAVQYGLIDAVLYPDTEVAKINPLCRGL